MANGWPDSDYIVIRGGSVELVFDDGLYERDPKDPHRLRTANRKITKIVIVDDNGTQQYDSGENPNGLKWTITVSTK
jgi:hypothetical protein